LNQKAKDLEIEFGFKGVVKENVLLLFKLSDVFSILSDGNAGGMNELKIHIPQNSKINPLFTRIRN